MCGRYSLGRTDRVDWASLGISPFAPLHPRWNIAPGSDVLAVRHGADGHEAALLRWGLIPSWAKDPSIGHKLANARAETAHEKPSFRAAFKSRRCLLPADGFYEWQVVEGRRIKQPWRIERADGAVLALGGLWEFWRSPDGERVDSCTVLTVPVNASLANIHARLPLILEPHDWNRWLSPHTSVEKARELLHASADGVLDAWPIGDAVNATRNDDESLTLSCRDSTPTTPRP